MYHDGKLSFYQEYVDESGKYPLYRTGKWKEYGAGIELSLNRMDFTKKLEVNELSRNWLVLKFTGDDSQFNGTKLKCQTSRYFSNKSYDMLDPANNMWRQKPRQKESPEELEARVLDHVQYLIAYFKLVEDKKQTFFETTPLQTPIRFHSNGISLPADFENDNAWLSCFYNEADAAAGVKILVSSLRSISDYPSDPKSYTKGYHYALVMMAEYLRK